MLYHGGSGGSSFELKRLITPGEFTVSSSSEKVYFTTGNLQYLGNEKTGNKWRFADNQWDFMANGPTAAEYPGNVTISTYTNYNIKNSDSEINQKAARDLFPWATSGIGGHHQPYDVGWNSGDYSAYGALENNLYDGDGTADWGKNTIYGRNDWRTLKAAEYVYLLGVEDDGRKVRDKDGKSVEPFGYGRINGVDGMIILPKFRL